MQMGAVREVRITFNPTTASFDIPVVIELDPTPFKQGEAGEADAKRVQDAVAAIVRKGLRAELGAANLIPGGLAVMLELQPKTGPAELRQGEGGLLEIPTAGKPLERVTVQVERVVARISALPLEQTVAEVNSLIAAARRIVEDPALKQLLADLTETSEALAPAARRLDPTLRAAADMAAPGRRGPGGDTGAARAVKDIAARSRPRAHGTHEYRAFAAAAGGHAGAATAGAAAR